MDKKKKSLVGYVIKRWRSNFKLLGEKDDRYWDFPEIGEKPMEGIKQIKVRITIEEL